MSGTAGEWIRSTYCADQACVEVSEQGGEVLVRDSKRLDVPYLRFTTTQWNAFVDAIAQQKIHFGDRSP